MLRETGLFPRRLLEAVGVGELTGTTAETLDRLADAAASSMPSAARTGLSAAMAARPEFSDHQRRTTVRPLVDYLLKLYRREMNERVGDLLS